MTAGTRWSRRSTRRSHIASPTMVDNRLQPLWRTWRALGGRDVTADGIRGILRTDGVNARDLAG